MANRRHQQQTQQAHEDADLLRQLMASVPTIGDDPLAPVALRSVATQRDHALRGFLRRSWVDGALRTFEQVMVFAALGIFLYWFLEGPVYDWMHVANAMSGSLPATAVMRVPVAPPEQQQVLASPVALPFTTPDMAQTSSDGFLQPGSDFFPVKPPTALEPTHLSIPAIGLETPVKETFVVNGAWEVADYAAGYMHGTALPGDGNTALAGHAGLRGAVFQDLGQLSPGDDVFLDAGGWRYQYKIRSLTAVWPTQTEVLAASDTPILTMLTCTNWDTQRLVVVADLVASKPVPGT